MPIKAKFQQMLDTWLKTQTGSKADIVNEFCAAMSGIGLATPAEEFKEKVLFSSR